jgi:hypothetical protein
MKKRNMLIAAAVFVPHMADAKLYVCMPCEQGAYSTVAGGGGSGWVRIWKLN